MIRPRACRGRREDHGMIVMSRAQGCCEVCRILLCMYLGSDTLKLDADREDARWEVVALPAGVKDMGARVAEEEHS
jgi:hypothetical protein